MSLTLTAGRTCRMGFSIASSRCLSHDVRNSSEPAPPDRLICQQMKLLQASHRYMQVNEVIDKSQRISLFKDDMIERTHQIGSDDAPGGCLWLKRAVFGKGPTRARRTAAIVMVRVWAAQVAGIIVNSLRLKSSLITKLCVLITEPSMPRSHGFHSRS